MRKAAFVAVFIQGCVPTRTVSVDTTLPEMPQVDAWPEPWEALVADASNLDPTVRALALARLVEVARPEERASWVTRGVFDPEPWVQRRTAEAAVDLGLQQSMMEFVGLPGADAYVRGWVAMRLPAASVGELVTQAAATPRLDFGRAPLALAAAKLGDSDAQAVLENLLAAAEVEYDPGFFMDLASSALPVADALTQGSEWVEDDLAWLYALAQDGLGSPDGRAVLTQAVMTGDAESRLGALEILQLCEADWVTGVLKRAESASEREVAATARAAQLVRQMAPYDAFEPLLADESETVRAVGLHALARRGPPEQRIPRKIVRVVAESLVFGTARERVGAALAIRSGVPVDRTSLKRALLDDLPSVRIEAAAALVAAGG